MKKLSIRESLARSEAYQEAADHLRQTWTDDETEFAQGLIVAERLEVFAGSWLLGRIRILRANKVTRKVNDV